MCPKRLPPFVVLFERQDRNFCESLTEYNIRKTEMEELTSDLQQLQTQENAITSRRPLKRNDKVHFEIPQRSNFKSERKNSNQNNEI